MRLLGRSCFHCRRRFWSGGGKIQLECAEGALELDACAKCIKTVGEMTDEFEKYMERLGKSIGEAL